MENNKKLLSANSFLFFKLIELLCEIEVEIINRNNVINLINSSTSDEYLIALLNSIMIERSIRSANVITLTCFEHNLHILITQTGFKQVCGIGKNAE